MQTIINIRAKTEGIKLAEDAADYLAEVGARTSLRYAVQLLTPSRVLSRINGRDEICRDDIEEIGGMFYDAKASAKVLSGAAASTYLQ